MTTATRITTLTALPFTAIYALITALFCPVMIGFMAHLIFAAGSTSCSLITFVCFAWGAVRLWEWWDALQGTIRALTRRPRRLRAQW